MLKKIISVCCVFIITFFMFFTVAWRAFHFIKSMNLKKLYPSNETEISKNNNGISDVQNRTILTTLSFYKNLLFEIENKHINTSILHATATYMPLFERVYDYYALLGWNLNKNTDPDYRIALDLGNGFFITENNLMKKLDVTPNVQGLNDLNNFLGSRGIDFLYVQTPALLCRYDKQEQLDYSNENIDVLLRELSQLNIPNIDLREHIHNNDVLSIQEERLKHHNYYLKTDHHWKPETGLWATKIIAEYLNANNGFNIDTNLFSPDMYRYEIKDWYVGSTGRKLAPFRAPPEDFSLIYPKFNTDLSINISESNFKKRGTFDITYDYRAERKIYSSTLNLYGVYGQYQRNSELPMHIHNNMRYDGKKVLFIGDSYFSTVVPFFALGTRQTHERKMIYY